MLRVATTATDARRALLERLIDHAALFPPASMSMAAALAEDRRVREGAAAWLVGRLVVPASRLGELPAGTSPRLSVVLDAPLEPDERIEAVESRPGADPASLTGLAPEVYVELPFDDAQPAQLELVAALGLRAKLRCGGASVPSVADLAAAVRRCRELGLAFKATAGLHHALRRVGEHGFLNLLAAAVFGDEERALAEEDAAAFAITPEIFAWRGRAAGADEISRVRRELFTGFGSCSVAEPAGELRALGIL